LWIMVYSESYINKKNEVDGKKARSKEEEKNFQKENDKRARCYRIFLALLFALDLIFGTMQVVFINRNDILWMFVLGLLLVNLVQKAFLGTLIFRIRELIKADNENPENCQFTLHAIMTILMTFATCL
jgi:hypothetical protein